NGVRAFGRTEVAPVPTPTEPSRERSSSHPRASSPLPDTGSRPSFSAVSLLSSVSRVSAVPAAPLADLDPSELGDSVEFLARMLGARASGTLTASGESVDD